MPAMMMQTLKYNSLRSVFDSLLYPYQLSISSDMTLAAVCIFTGAIFGRVYISTIPDDDRNLNVVGQVGGLPPGNHSAHAYEFGDVGNKCNNLGKRFNSYNLTLKINAEADA